MHLMPQARVVIEMVGVRRIETKAEHYSIMYANFCTYHAHCFHADDSSQCKQWMKLVTRRMANREEIKKAGDSKASKRRDEYKGARYSTASTSRF